MECGECTACCLVCVVPEFEKKAGEHCINCISDGCIIYGNHPQSCKDFECAYYQGGNNIKLRPDKCGIVFFKKNKNIFCGILIPDIPVTNLAKEQIASFIKQGYSVVMLKIGEKPHIIPSKGRDHVGVYREYVNQLIDGHV